MLEQARDKRVYDRLLVGDDESWAEANPKWFARYRHHPVSFAIVWRHTANAGC